MSRGPHARLLDIASACEAIEEYSARADPDDVMYIDAVRIRLVEIGEAIKGIDPRILEGESSVPWRDIARMRDSLTHRYFVTSRSMIVATARSDVPLLAAAVERLLDTFPADDSEPH